MSVDENLMLIPGFEASGKDSHGPPEYTTIVQPCMPIQRVNHFLVSIMDFRHTAQQCGGWLGVQQWSAVNFYLPA